MNEELKVETKVETVVEEVVEPQFTPVETDAMEQGWLPKEQWEESGKDPAEWRTAKEFKERGEFFKTIHQTKRELKQTQTSLDALRKHHNFVFDQAYRKAKVELRKERRDAIKSEDFERLDEIETEIDKLDDEYSTQKTQMQTEVAQAQNTGTPPEFEVWQSRNSWYTEDQDLHDYADAQGLIYTRRNPGANPLDVLRHVEADVKKKFPEKFGGRKAAPNAVAAPNRAGTGRKATAADYQLSETEQAIMNDLIKGGVMTKDEYIADLKKVKGEK